MNSLKKNLFQLLIIAVSTVLTSVASANVDKILANCSVSVGSKKDSSISKTVIRKEIVIYYDLVSHDQEFRIGEYNGTSFKITAPPTIGPIVVDLKITDRHGTHFLSRDISEQSGSFLRFMKTNPQETLSVTCSFEIIPKP